MAEDHRYGVTVLHDPKLLTEQQPESVQIAFEYVSGRKATTATEPLTFCIKLSSHTWTQRSSLQNMDTQAEPGYVVAGPATCSASKCPDHDIWIQCFLPKFYWAPRLKTYSDKAFV